MTDDLLFAGVAGDAVWRSLRERMDKEEERSLIMSAILTYRTWQSLRSRTSNPRAVGYIGDRFRMPPEWKDFEGFLDDLGLRPSPRHHLQRKELDQGFSKDNCVWVETDAVYRDPKLLLTIDGVTMTATQASKKYKVPAALLRKRVRDGLRGDDLIQPGRTVDWRSYGPTYHAWRSMKSRKLPITERWADYENFLADMGEKPSAAHRLTRKNKTKPCSRDNCMWSAPKRKPKPKA